MALGLTKEEWERVLDSIHNPDLSQYIRDAVIFGQSFRHFSASDFAPDHEPESQTMNDQTPSLENSLDRLIKIMKMTTSGTDGEALAAIRMANSQLAKLKTDWEAVLRGKVSIIQDPFGGVPVVNARAPQPASPPPPPSPRPQPQYQPQPRAWNAPPRPRPAPPPPRFPHTNDQEIEGYFALVKLKHWGKKTTIRLQNIQSFWNQNHGLDHTDYDFLKQCATGGQASGSINDL